MALGNSDGDLNLLRVNEKSTYWKKLIKSDRFGEKQDNNAENGIYPAENGNFFTIETRPKFQKLSLHDKYMKSFKYKSALDSVISVHF